MTEEKYDSLSHAKLRLTYHIVLATKHRRPVIKGLERELEKSFERACEGQKFTILDVGVDQGNHVHLLVRVRNPRIGIGWIVGRLKRFSTHDVYETHEEQLQRFYRGRKKKLWSNGYFAATAGHDETTVSKYIQAQAQ